MSSATDTILDLIPQRPPFVFVDKLSESTDSRSVVQFTVPSDSPLSDSGHLTAAGLMEHIAQACAVHTGFRQVQNRQPVRIGYIGSVKKMTTRMFPDAGTVIRTEVVLLESVFDISLFQCTCHADGTEIAQATIKLALV